MSPAQQPPAQLAALQVSVWHMPALQPLGQTVSTYEYAQRPLVPSHTPAGVQRIAGDPV